MKKRIMYDPTLEFIRIIYLNSSQQMKKDHCLTYIQNHLLNINSGHSTLHSQVLRICK